MAQIYAPASTPAASAHSEGRIGGLILGCVGVVYGDIGTSPLYAIKQAATAVQADGGGATGIIGMLSMIFWCLVLIVTIKYVFILLRADNKGEGRHLRFDVASAESCAFERPLVFGAWRCWCRLFLWRCCNHARHVGFVGS